MPPSPSELSDEQLSPNPSPSLPQEETLSPSPLFRSPTSPPPLPSSPPEDLPSWLSLDEPPSTSPDDAFGSPPPSTGKKSGRPKLRELREMAKAAVQTAGNMAHQILTAPGTAERAFGLYLPDDDDVKAISDPVASLASRRMPEGAENPDVADLVRLAFGLLVYGVKQRERFFRARDQADWSPEYEGPAGEPDDEELEQ
jgi:hypothetical protein